MNAEQIWQAALGDLKLQMTKATFDTWLKDTRLVSFDGYTLEIAAPTPYAQDWLQHRLLSSVNRTLTDLVGRQVQVSFVATDGHFPKTDTPPPVTEPPDKPDTIAVRFLEFDPMKKGYLQMPKYCEWFWQPFLGPIPYATYRHLRTLDFTNDGWGSWHTVKIEVLAATVAGGNRQAITGVQRRRKGQTFWRPGSLDVLSDAGVIRFESPGRHKNRVSYRITCLNSLPLLTPAQVSELPEVLQSTHADFLRRCKLDQEEWTQLELPTLVAA